MFNDRSQYDKPVHIGPSPEYAKRKIANGEVVSVVGGFECIKRIKDVTQYKYIKGIHIDIQSIVNLM